MDLLFFLSLRDQHTHVYGESFQIQTLLGLFMTLKELQENFSFFYFEMQYITLIIITSNWNIIFYIIRTDSTCINLYYFLTYLVFYYVIYYVNQRYDRWK